MEWLGEVPAHWEICRTKTLLVQRVEKGHPNEPLLAATQTKGVVQKRRYENRTVLAMKDLHLLKLVHAGDFVISLRSFQGGIEYARDQGIISPAYTILYPVQADHHGYLAKLFKSAYYIENLALFVTGIRQGQNIDYERLSRSRLPVPPIDEQTAIVRFLDHATGRIERQIRAKEKLITLLEEQKQVVVNDAVTGRIDVRTGQPYPEYKDSGVEWLGEVPGHWEVRRLKHWLLLNQLTLGEDTDPDFTFEYVEIGAVGTGRLVAPTQRIKFHGSPSRARRIVRNGDTIVSTVRTYLKAIYHISDIQSDLIVSTGFAVLTPTSSTCSKFVSYVCQSGSFTGRVSANSAGVAYPGIAESKFSAFEVAIPPLSEQTAITRYLDDAIANTSSAIDRANREIELLREYRTRLIADVVTGKLDVREVAADLPDEAILLAQGERDASIALN